MKLENFSIFDYGKSGPTHFYMSLENLKAIAHLVSVLEFEANECEKLVIFPEKFQK